MQIAPQKKKKIVQNLQSLGYPRSYIYWQQ